MVQIVLSISKEHNKKLRDLAMNEFASKKGALSAIVEKGIDLADEEIKREAAHKRLIWLARNKAGEGDGKFDRNEVYSERIRKITSGH
ncbi:MAG: hypothetical protein NTY48_04110 [Candidatus Diapherotrites archaeon]|nr:hypothetical protein [Candidatus Diapherotrites archaeon]